MMFGNYQFTPENHENVLKLCKKLSSIQKIDSIKYHPWSILLDKSTFTAVSTDQNFSETDDPQKTQPESKYIEEEDEKMETEIVYLSDSSEEVPCPSTILTPSVSIEGTNLNNHKESSSVLDLSQSCSQWSEVSTKKQELHVPGVLYDIQDDVLKLKDYMNTGSEMNVCNLAFITAVTTEQMEALLTFLQSDQLDEPNLCLLCTLFVNKAEGLLGYNCGVVFVNKCILPSISTLEKNVSRRLLNVLTNFFKIYPLLCVFMLSEITVSFNLISSPSVADFLMKIIKDVLGTDAASAVLRNIVVKISDLPENLVVIVQALLDKIKSISNSELEMLVSILANCKEEYSKNLKFAKLVLKLIQQFGKQFDENIRTSVQLIISANKTFLKRSLENNLMKEAE